MPSLVCTLLQSGLYEVLVQLQQDIGADPTQIYTLEALVHQSGGHVKDAFLGVLHSRVMPAARAALPPVSHAPRVPLPEPSPASAQCAPLVPTISEVKHMIESFLPPGLLEPATASQQTGPWALGASSSAATSHGHKTRSECSSSTDRGDHESQHTAHEPMSQTTSHAASLGITARPAYPSVLPTALMQAYASNTSAGGNEDEFAMPGAAFLNGPACYRDDGPSSRDGHAPHSAGAGDIINALAGLSTSSLPSHAGSQGPSSRAASPVVMSPAAHGGQFSSHSQQSQHASLLQPPPPPPPSQSPHQRAMAAGLAMPQSVSTSSDMPLGSFDSVYHNRPWPLDGPGMTSLGPGSAHRPGGPVNGGHGTLSAPGSFRRQPPPPAPPSVLNLQQTLLDLQQQHATRSSDAGSTQQQHPNAHLPLLQQHQSNPDAYSESLLASLLALDSQAQTAYLNQASAAGALPPSFDVSQLVSLLAASGANPELMGDYMGDSPADNSVSRTDSYGAMQRSPYVAPIASQLNQMTPAAAVAAAGRALSLQQAQDNAHLTAQLQLQSLRLQQQQLALQQQQGLQPQQVHQMLHHQLQTTQRQEQEALAQRQAASTQRLAAAYSSGAFTGADLYSGSFGGAGPDAYAPAGSYGSPDMYGYPSSAAAAQPQEMPKRLQVLPEAVQNKIVDIVTKLPVLQVGAGVRGGAEGKGMQVLWRGCSTCGAGNAQ